MTTRTDHWNFWLCDTCGHVPVGDAQHDVNGACPKCTRGSFVKFPPAGPMTTADKKVAWRCGLYPPGSAAPAGLNEETA